MAPMYSKWLYNIPTFCIPRPPKIYPNWNFGLKIKISSGNPCSHVNDAHCKTIHSIGLYIRQNTKLRKMNKVQSQNELISIRVERLYKQGNECNVYTPWPREPGKIQ
jgi:hypothetical protein